MDLLSRKINTLRSLDTFDVVNLLGEMRARVITRLLLSPFFGRIGAGSWIKNPDQIIGPANVFIGERVKIEKHAVLYAMRKYFDATYNGTISIGDGTFINRNFNATVAFELSIGRQVAIGTNVFLNDFDHGYSDPNGNSIESELVAKGPIHIGDRSWIGSNTYVAGGVTLGEHCVVAANSVVTKSFPAFSVIAGAPARLIKRYDAGVQAWIACDTRAQSDLADKHISQETGML